MARYDTTEYNRYRRLRATPRDYADHPYDYAVRGGRDTYRGRGMTFMGYGMERTGARSGRYAPETRGYAPRRGYDVRGGYDVGGGYAELDRNEGYLGNWSPGGYGSSRGLDSLSGGRPRFFTGWGPMNQGAVGYHEYRPNWW